MGSKYVILNMAYNRTRQCHVGHVGHVGPFIRTKFNFLFECSNNIYVYYIKIENILFVLNLTIPL